jgi:soluble lytic murein transglycosylase-like protein
MAPLFPLLALMPIGAGAAQADAVTPEEHVHRVCTLISQSARRHGLPQTYFARLIWKESRFDANAVSPAGAEGVAQFMPGTANLRGLADPFDPDQAIPAAAAYLAEMRDAYGNLGLAAIGYNGGENRLARWLARGGFLPLETEDYVLSITGKPVEHFIDRANEVEDRPLHAELTFDEACRSLPVIQSATVVMASRHRLPWGIQVAGSFRRSAAVGQWQRLRRRYASVLAGYEPVVQRQRSPVGRRSMYAVRLGAKTRAEAQAVCSRLMEAGGVCLVMKN